MRVDSAIPPFSPHLPRPFVIGSMSSRRSGGFFVRMTVEILEKIQYTKRRNMGKEEHMTEYKFISDVDDLIFDGQEQGHSER